MNMLLTISILLLTNAAGILLRIYDLDPYVIIIGFRFHLSLILPALFLINKNYRSTAFKLLKNPGKFKYAPLLIIFFSIAVLFLALFAAEMLKLSDPDYFYELGLSSIIDFPVYLIWNLPHLLILTLFISSVSYEKKAGYLLALLIFILLFAYRLIPVEKEKFDIISAAQLFSAGLLFSLIIYKIRNVYLSSCLIFLSVWLYLLLSGSKSEEIINIFLGKYYSGWEGFFVTGKELQDYIFFLYIGVQLILVLVYILINAYNNKAVKNTAL